MEKNNRGLASTGVLPLLGYQERKFAVGLIGVIQACIGRLVYSETEFSQKKRMPGGDYEVQNR
ncbi:hypothetical protein A8L34_08680 [Bacillus sp. FJAT-27264]|nr:hypothetical protein A8L34_08680 [Bacillus sp. FJAT-27264]